MNPAIEKLALDAFRNAALRVPAYRKLLHESAVDAAKVTTIAGFHELPILDKRNTFQRFSVGELCVDGQLGNLATVLTSSGHSGVFAFGLAEVEHMPATVEWVDNMLDLIFQVRTKPALLINCLPMGVKVHCSACTLAETSVRPDMVVALVKAFGEHFAQIIMVGDAAFVKHTLEVGRSAGLDWSRFLIHVILGEELLAENARKYIEGLLGRDAAGLEKGLVSSSMGVGEVGLNIFSEVPPVGPLTALRRAFHEDDELRAAMFGDLTWVPSLFTYDPSRIFVEFGPEGRLIVTTLHQHLRLPLIRYATGDIGHFLSIPERLSRRIEEIGIPWTLVSQLPIVAIMGRGRYVSAAAEKVFPEAVKEGIYFDADLARLTTANFRLNTSGDKAHIRIQLCPGISTSSDLEARFSTAIARYVKAPLQVSCESYASFGSGMTLDYERKFDYFNN